MAINVIDNFSYRGKKPNFDRDSFDTLSAMKSFPETDIDEGHISFCKEDGKHYKFSSANDVDPTTGKWRENKELPDNIVLSKLSTGIPSIADVILGNILTKVEQELTTEEQAQVQINIGVKDTMDVVGVGEVRDIPVDIAQDNMYISSSGKLGSVGGYFISKPYAVKCGDIIMGTVTATENVAIISMEYSDPNNIPVLYKGKISGINYVVYLVLRDMNIVFSAGESTFKLVKAQSQLTKIVAAQIEENRQKLFESYGAVKNKVTGYWSLNGFDDISDEEMWNIYRYFNFNDMTMFAGRYPENGNLKIRTNIPFRLTVQNSTNSFFVIPHKWSYLCVLLKYVEKVVLSTDRNSIFLCADNFNGVNYLFYNCESLKEVDGIIDFSKFDGVLNYVFINCPKLKSFKLKGVHNNATFGGSPLINLDTWTYMIENATNTKAITIRVTAEAYSYLTGAADPIPDVGGTKAEWMALVTTAQEKQISFAQA